MPSHALQLLPVQAQRLGTGLRVAALRGHHVAMDPFIGVDHFRMTQPTFPPHPHAGFSAVTYLFDDAETGFVNRDSQGFEGPIAPGALHWTLAGRGLMHEELPQEPGRVAHGLQIFVNLPAATKLQAPRALHLAPEAMPVVQGPGWTARVVFGRWGAQVAPLDLPVDASLAIVDLAPGAALATPWIEGQQGFALVVRGEAVADGLPLPTGSAVAYRRAPPWRVAGDQPVRLALFAGTPLREPVVQHGPFVMNTEAQIVDALRRYQRGDMGQLQPTS